MARAGRLKTMSAWSYKHWCTHAELLNDARHRCTDQLQLAVLDWIIERLIHIYSEDAPIAFDPDWFGDKSAYGRYRNDQPLLSEGTDS